MIISGSFDLYITNVCNLHCKNCIVLDYKGEVTIPHLTLQDIKDIVEQIPHTIEHLQLVGGEPTLHPQLREIVTYLRGVPNLFERLSIVTNGTNYTTKTLEILEMFDVVIHTDYVQLGGRTPRLPNVVTTTYPQAHFYEWFNEKPSVQYSKQLNWNRCYMKNECAALTIEGVYHCPITMNERVEVTSYADMGKFRDRTEPLDFCEQCPMPCETQVWKSNLPSTDNRVYTKGRRNLIKLLNIE